MATAAPLFGSGLGEQELANQLLEQRAMQFAQLPQEQRLASMGFKAGANLGSGIAGLFGVDTVDPLVKRATMLRQMANQFDTTTPQGLRQLAGALKTQDPDMAMRVLQAADAMELSTAKIRSEEALAQQRTREKAAADPLQQIIRTGKFTPASIATYAKSGDVADLENIEKGDPTAVVETEEGVFLVNKVSGDKIARLGAATKKGTTVNVNPEKAGDILEVRARLNTTVKPFRDAVNAASEAITLANDAIQTGNFASAAAMQRQLAKAVGEQQISNQDVKSFGGDPSLIGTVADVTSRLLTGTPTVDTLKKMRKVAEIVRAKNQKLEDDEITSTKRLAEQSGKYTKDQIETTFSLRPGRTTGSKTRKTASGVEYTIEGE